MKLITTLVLAFAMIFSVACTKDQLCETGKKASGLVASQVAVQLDCKGVDAIRADIEVLLVKTKICEAPEQGVQALGPIGDLICKPVIDALVAGLVTQIPAKYECSGSGKITDEVKAKLVAACAKAI